MGGRKLEGQQAVRVGPFTDFADGYIVSLQHYRTIRIDRGILQELDVSKVSQVLFLDDASKVWMSQLTRNDLLFPNAILVIDEAVTLYSIAQFHELLAHLFQAFLGDEGLCTLELRFRRLHHIFLALKDS